MNEILDEIEIIKKTIISKQKEIKEFKEEIENVFKNPDMWGLCSRPSERLGNNLFLIDRNTIIEEEIKDLKQELRNLKIDYLFEIEMKKQIRTEI